MPRASRTGPWQRGPYDVRAAHAIQAIRRGNASAQQQTYALDFIVRHICGGNQMTYWPGPEGDRATCFAEGKRWVGNEIGFYLLPIPEKFLQPGSDAALMRGEHG